MINQLISESAAIRVPVVGEGITFLSYSDRSPGTVAKVFSDKCIAVTRCDCTIVPKADGSSYEYGEHRDYTFQPETKEELEEKYKDAKKEECNIFTLRKNGCWVRLGGGMHYGQGSRIAVGYRDQYRDPSF